MHLFVYFVRVISYLMPYCYTEVVCLVVFRYVVEVRGKIIRTVLCCIVY